MTREEAIANLNMTSVAFVEPVTEEQRKLIDDTFEMAIQALSQEPCEDAIDRAEAMTEIMMFAGNVKSDEEDIYIKVSDAVQLLRELPPVTQKSGKWIPCSEKLPEYTINDKVSENVLVFDGTDIRIGEYRKGIHLHGAGYWRVFGYEIDEYVDVIAWMPLPKPYEPQERSDKE